MDASEILMQHDPTLKLEQTERMVLAHINATKNNLLGKGKK